MTSDEIVTGARTVTNLAEYFDEMKQKAVRMREEIGARKRGYFTPSEEETVRQLHVSYWQARSALFDLLTSYRMRWDDPDSPIGEKDRPATFLVAYAAAVLLVDAGRFLRETFEDAPVIRDKLNDADPLFGIPAGTYDMVQNSLTQPAHAWRLYQANDFFDAHKAKLRALAFEPLLAPVVSVIDRLGGRIRVPVKRYLLARIRFRMRQFFGGLHRDVLGAMLYSIQEVASRLVSDVYTVPGHHPEIPRSVADELRSLLAPGDVFITRKDFALTNYFLPGYWPHAALYLGDERSMASLGIADHAQVRSRRERWVKLDQQEPRRVLEAMKDGVWIRSLNSPFGSDALVVVRPLLSTDDVAHALVRGLAHDGKQYDFDFDFSRSERMVCTEVIYRTYEGIGDVRFELTRRAGRLTLAAEDIISMALARRHFQPIAVFAPSHADGLVTGAYTDELLTATRRSFAQAGESGS